MVKGKLIRKNPKDKMCTSDVVVLGWYKVKYFCIDY